MAERLDTAAVLGAGVMGSALAAHFAGAGVRVHLLDIVPPNLKDNEKSDPQARSRFAIEGLDKALKAKPAAFYDPDAARLVTPGNLDDHLERLRECDLVIEAVVERLDIKKSLFGKIAPFLKSDVILASNTSGLSIAGMSGSLPASLQKRFLVMHFFNPVRYMRLLEIVPGPKTDPAVLQRAARIGEFLGKGVVYGKDTPNFIGNRIGIYGMMGTIHQMLKEGFGFEEVDKIVGKPMGRPSSAAFGTADLVGLDTFVHVAQNCYDSLPNDEERDIFKIPELIQKMVKEGRLGRKTGAGFFKKVGKDIQVLDPKTGEYRPQNKVKYDSLGAVKGIEDVGERLKALVNYDDKAGHFAWTLTERSLAYTARRVGDIADDIVNIDHAMCWGFNWEKGPFEAWDAIGVKESVGRMQKDGVKVPAWVLQMIESGRTSFYDGPPSQRTYWDVATKSAKPLPKDPKHLELAAIKDDKKRIVKENMGAALVDLGDGCLCLEVHTKMNTIDGDVVEMLNEAVTEAEKNYEGLVIGNDGEHFGAGANLMLVFLGAQNKAWNDIEKAVRDLQNALQRVKYARVPVVAAPFGYTFGGGAETVMACAAAQAYAETYIGLVEVGVGLIPAGCGCTRMVERWTGNVTNVQGVDLLPLIAQGFLNIAMAKVATGAEEGRRLRFLSPWDGVSLNRTHLLYEAKQRALGLARAGYRPPLPRVFKAAGYDAARTIGLQLWGMVEAKYATEYDAVVGNKVANVVCGGQVAAGTLLPEQHYLDLEREAFLSLCGEEKTQARMQSMLTTNKPLRN
jgi:3-hydroxyacyl-CoA dehydrogenase